MSTNSSRGAQSPERSELVSTRIDHPHLRDSSRRRKQTTVTPQQYIQSIYAHSQRFITNSSFTGPNYIDLANWILANHDSFLTEENEDTKHQLAIIYDLCVPASEKASLLTRHEIALLSGRPPPDPGKGQLLFLRGYLPPQWIVEVGSKYRVDPEFFQRHLDFFASSAYRHCFSLPSLPSTSSNIIHVHINTIISNDYSLSDFTRDLLDRRRETVEHVAQYKEQLQARARCGDSIVRDFNILNDRFSVIEQRISICITENGDGWLGLVWMDNGKDLHDSPPGPWNSYQHGKSSTIPVVQHHPKMTRRKLNISDNNAAVGAGETFAKQTPLPQGISKLPLDYTSILSAVDLASRSVSDPLHALVPIFVHAAFSEVAVLNLIRELVQQEMEPSSLEYHRTVSFENLQYLEGILQRHTAQIKQCVKVIGTLFKSGGGAHHRTRSFRSGSEGRQDAFSSKDSSFFRDTASATTPTSFSPEGVLQDYEELLATCIHLSDRCVTAMNTNMNKTMILEARKAMEQNSRLKKLTLLATYFIPLTFTASLFGMNFSVLGQGEQPLWWYLVLAAPLTLLTHVLNHWDIAKSMESVPKWTRDRWRRRPNWVRFQSAA